MSSVYVLAGGALIGGIAGGAGAYVVDTEMARVLRDSKWISTMMGVLAGVGLGVIVASRGQVITDGISQVTSMVGL